jgi:cytochrome P450
MAALSQKNLRTFYPALEQVAARLLRRWQLAADQGRALDLAEELKLFTVDVTTLLVFGRDVNTLEKPDEDVIQRHLEHIFPALNRRLIGVIPYWRYLRLPEDRRLDRSLAELGTWLSSLIERARERLAADPAAARSSPNFLDAMLSARDAEGKPFADDIIFGNALTMLLAGEDTTAYTLTWAVHHLCDAPDAVRELRREAEAVLGRSRVPADLEQASQLSFAGAVANETMRLRPVAPGFFLEANRDVVVGDVAVPMGTVIVYLSRPPAVHAKNFHDPLAFAPERWLEGAANGQAHEPSASVPFGSGPRICPGRALALLEMRVVLATLYRNFEVDRIGKSAHVKERTAFTMIPVGVRVKLRRRG